MGIFKRSEKVLALARNTDIAAVWISHFHYKWFCHSAIYLYALLGGVAMPEAVLGISAYYHDSAAALLIDGQIIAAAHEERFTRKKHDPSFPSNAIKYVLNESGLRLDDFIAIAFYDKPYLKFERLLETYHGFAPRGLRSFLSAMPVWIKEKLFTRSMLKEELERIDKGKSTRILFPDHHLSHAASAFFPSPFEEAAIITVDGVGEWATTTIGKGVRNKISLLRQMDFPHSLGLLYSAFTYFCGFKVNSGEYKLMGLAPYGNAKSNRVVKWIEQILDQLVDVREDGSFLLNMDYFDFATGLTMCNDLRWEALFGLRRRASDGQLDQSYMDLAYAIQSVTEKILFKLARTAKEITDAEYLVMAGGVALNCVANGKLLKSNLYKDIWIQPAAGDAGGALGAAYAAWHIGKKKDRKISHGEDSMQGTYLGPEFDDRENVRMARRYGCQFDRYADFDKLCRVVAEQLATGNVVGWFQGRMEYGPRALGNRSILGNPCHPEMQKKLNLKIKFRESFRPFAPSVLEEDIAEYFELDRSSPYMLFVAQVQQERTYPAPEHDEEMEMYERLYCQRSDMPAITHVDYSARIQSVSRKTNEKYWKLIHAFKVLTGYGVIVNTSFNVRGEPIVCNPDDAYRCFMRTEMDYLVIGDCLYDKKLQPAWREKPTWREDYALD